ncbi:MAG: chromosomal replication initiator protein DnaA [Bacilli bacterium]|jgi:chromosomal replication initiator protein|nr:chromosomal replication initiator protein DnaA [Bacilli bacterium]
MDQSVSEIVALWSRILVRIKERVNDSLVYDNFFADTYIDSIKNNTIIVVANSGLAVSVLSSQYKQMIDSVVHEATESNFEVRFVEAGQVKKESEKTPQKALYFADVNKLNPAFTFKTFVVGQSNRPAYQAALVVSQNPGRLYNPLLIYSNSGLGKTHLLHAIGSAIKERNPQTRVLYITTQDFLDEYIKFVKGDSEGQNIKDFFRDNVDVLLVDDIQFLVGKHGTEELFFSVFQTLYNAGKQIVITCDVNPTQLQGLDARLRTRFTSGLPIDIKTPDKETCESILRMKIQANGLSVDAFDPEVISYFAQKFGNNVRELEGALNRLLFYIVNVHPTVHVNLQTAMDSVRDLTNVQDDETKLSIGRIINTVADYYNLAPYTITGRIRTSQIALARHIAMYLVRTMLDVTYTKIGQAFGGKDHATVMNGVEKVDNSLKNDRRLQATVSELKGRLGSKDK